MEWASILPKLSQPHPGGGGNLPMGPNKAGVPDEGGVERGGEVEGGRPESAGAWNSK